MTLAAKLFKTLSVSHSLTRIIIVTALTLFKQELFGEEGEVDAIAEIVEPSSANEVSR